MIQAISILILFNALNSRIDAYRIMAHKQIAHAVNFGAYTACFLILLFVFGLWGWAATPLFTINAFCNRQLVFDILLNLRRNLDWDYVSLDRPPKAWWDRVEVKIFGYNGKLQVLIYGIVFLATLIILLLT